MIRAIVVFFGLSLLSACASQDLDQPLADLGDFRLGYDVVVASKMQKGPVSREATEDEWKAALISAVDGRFKRYEGDKLYHLGISVEGYMLAPPGIPVLYTPKSALLLKVTVWDDAAGKKLNGKPHQLMVLENTDEKSFLIGSGWGRGKEQQITGLSDNAAFAIEHWLVEQKDQLGWFTGGPIREAPPEKPGAETGI